MKAEFTPSLLTGNKMIDGQHMELIAKINALYESLEKGEGKEGALKTLDFLTDYTTYHFDQEEKLQEEIKYPKLAEHKKAHADLVQVVVGLRKKLLADGPSADFIEDLNKKVTAWLYDHIQGFDMDVAEYKNIRTGGMMENML